MKKKLYHLCVSAPEIMFRVPEDYIQGINRACLSAYRNNTELLAYAFMSNHFHIIAETNNPDVFIGSMRNGYTKWFNNKYARKGPLGYNGFHSVELTNLNHILDGTTYVLKNGVHHNVVTYPSGYPYCSAKYYFMKELGIHVEYTPLTTWKEQRKHVPWTTKLPPGYTLDKSGLFIQEYILQCDMVEHYYGSVGKFTFYMNKSSSNEWSTFTIESWMGEKAKDLLTSEKAVRKIKRYNDIDVCQFIDDWLSKNKTGETYVTLSYKDKMILAELLKLKRVSHTQIARCLNINVEELSPYKVNGKNKR